jgi:hypothetical protein
MAVVGLLLSEVVSRFDTAQEQQFCFMTFP